MNPSGRPMDPHQLTSAQLHLHLPPSAYLAAQQPRLTHLVTSAAVFHGPKPHLLIVQRAESDSYPGHWELPGGTADSSDKTIADCLARELKEETGLVVEKVGGWVRPGETFNTGWGKRLKRWVKLSFVVSVVTQNGDGGAIGGIEATAEDSKVVSSRPFGDLSDKDAARELEEVDVLASYGKLVGSHIGAPKIVLNTNEHQSYLWVTEEEIRERKVRGVELKFPADENIVTLVGAFETHKRSQDNDDGDI